MGRDGSSRWSARASWATNGSISDLALGPGSGLSGDGIEVRAMGVAVTATSAHGVVGVAPGAEDAAEAVHLGEVFAGAGPDLLMLGLLGVE